MDRGELRATRGFFGPRAAGWEDRFPDDGPAYEAAVAALDLPSGATALDAACGTGRAVPPLRRSVGPAGRVLAVDVTQEMLDVLVAKGRAARSAAVLADAGRLPLIDGCVEGTLAAGLLPHVPAPVALTELARVTAAGGRLVLFHPIGRRALAARHGGVPDPADIRAEAQLGPALSAAGWELVELDDGEERYLALAVRAADRPG